MFNAKSNEMQYCISFDWLQLHVKMPVCQLKGILPVRLKDNFLYHVEKQGYSTRHFRDVYEVQRVTLAGLWEPCAVLVCNPPDKSVLPKDMGLLKIDNKYLYQADLRVFVQELIDNLGVVFKSISRLDVAADFNKFLGDDPEDFIKKFVSGQYLKLHKSSFSTEFDVNEDVEKDLMTFYSRQLKNMGEQKFIKKYVLPYHNRHEKEHCSLSGKHQQVNIFEYLRFGTNTSEICYYLYNKSKELKERKDKPWIRQNWQDNGLDASMDTWRLEFSVKSNCRDLVQFDEDGEVRDISPLKSLDILDWKRVNILYAALFERYFNFVFDDGKSRKDRMRRVDTLKFEGTKAVVMRLSEKVQSSRMDKVFLKKLNCVNNELRGVDLNYGFYLEDTIFKYAARHGLVDWYAQKIDQKILNASHLFFINNKTNSHEQGIISGDFKG